MRPPLMSDRYQRERQAQGTGAIVVRAWIHPKTVFASLTYRFCARSGEGIGLWFILYQITITELTTNRMATTGAIAASITAPANITTRFPNNRASVMRVPFDRRGQYGDLAFLCCTTDIPSDPLDPSQC